MKIVHIKTTKQVKKTKREIEQEEKNKVRTLLWLDQYKTILLKEPIYIVEMSMEEIQLVSFYLELEKRKPIMNINIVKGDNYVSSKR